MILTIKTIQEKEEETQYGKKTKFYIKFEEKPDKTVSSFLGKWNSSYREQTRIDVNSPEEQKDPNKPTLEVKEIGERVYYNLKAPEAARGGFDNKELIERVDFLQERIEKLAERMGVVEHKTNSPEDPEEMPLPEEEL